MMFFEDLEKHELANAMIQLYLNEVRPLSVNALEARYKLTRCTMTIHTLNDEQPKLTPREPEILAFLAKGFSYVEIASLLQISPHTVTTITKKIYRKLSVHSRGEAVYEATPMGLIN